MRRESGPSAVAFMTGSWNCNRPYGEEPKLQYDISMGYSFSFEHTRACVHSAIIDTVHFVLCAVLMKIHERLIQQRTLVGNRK